MQFNKTSPLNLEKVAKNPVEKIASNPVTSVAVMVFSALSEAKQYDFRINYLQNSGTKKEPKPKLLSPDIFRWGGGLPREGVGAKKFGMSLETQGIKLFRRDIPGFCRDIPEAPEKFEKKMFGFIFWPLRISKAKAKVKFGTG